MKEKPRRRYSMGEVLFVEQQFLFVGIDDATFSNHSFGCGHICKTGVVRKICISLDDNKY